MLKKLCNWVKCKGSIVQNGEWVCPDCEKLGEDVALGSCGNEEVPCGNPATWITNDTIAEIQGYHGFYCDMCIERLGFAAIKIQQPIEEKPRAVWLKPSHGTCPV